jgi:hypothetical protein
VNRLLLLLLAALVAAVVLAARLGGALGGGVLLGTLLGAGLAGVSTLHVRHVARTRPAKALQALTLGFLVKLGALLLGGLALRFLEPVAARADYRAFLIAFAGAVALVLPLGLWSLLRDRKNPTANPMAQA